MAKKAPVVAAVLIVSLLITACGSAPTPTRSPAPATVQPPTPSPVASTPTPAASPSGALTLGTDPFVELAPGTYSVANPPLEFTIPEPTDDARWFGGADPSGGFYIRRATDSCDGCEPGHIAVIVTPASIDAAVAEWTALEGASLTSVEPVELGGATGVRFEGGVPAELNVAIVHGGYNPHGLVAVYVLDAGGHIVVIAINQYSTDEPFFDDARPVVDSFVFDV